MVSRSCTTGMPLPSGENADGSGLGVVGVGQGGGVVVMKNGAVGKWDVMVGGVQREGSGWGALGGDEHTCVGLCVYEGDR